MEKILRLIVPIITLLFSSYLQAKVLETAYLTTQVPNNWECKLSGGRWVCRVQTKGYDSRVVVSLTAKPTSPEETIENFLSQLNTTKTLTSKTGNPIVSKVISAKKVFVNKVIWVEAVHFESEVPNYYTQYMVTVNGGITILLRLSAHKDVFETMKPYFTNVILNTRLKKLGNIAPLKKSPQGHPLPVPATPQPTTTPTASPTGPAQKSQDLSPLVIGTFVLIAAGFSIVFFYRRKKF